MIVPLPTGRDELASESPLPHRMSTGHTQRVVRSSLAERSAVNGTSWTLVDQVWLRLEDTRADYAARFPRYGPRSIGRNVVRVAT